MSKAAYGNNKALKLFTSKEGFLLKLLDIYI